MNGLAQSLSKVNVAFNIPTSKPSSAVLDSRFDLRPKGYSLGNNRRSAESWNRLFHTIILWCSPMLSRCALLCSLNALSYSLYASLYSLDAPLKAAIFFLKTEAISKGLHFEIYTCFTTSRNPLKWDVVRPKPCSKCAEK